MSATLIATCPLPSPSWQDTADWGGIAAQWRAARRLYPVYAELARRFELGAPCGELESPIDRSEPEAIVRVQQWFARMDERIEAWHLRQLVQTTSLVTETTLRELLTRCLEKKNKGPAERDKIDFLLVQYFAQCAPPPFHVRNFDLEDVASVLEPVLGEAATHQPPWLSPLDDILDALPECSGLRDLMERGILVQVRELKNSAGEMYFGTAVMLAFTRFNFLMRRAFFRLLQADLQATLGGLSQLELRGMETIDCTCAQLSEHEPLASLRKICQGWKPLFRAPYCNGKTFEQLIAIRTAVEDAVARPVAQQEPSEELMVAGTANKPGWPVTPELQQCMEDIASQLVCDRATDPLFGAAVVVGQAGVLLSSWEVADFLSGPIEPAPVLQRAVAARALLLDALLQSQWAGVTPCFASVLDLAHAEAAEVQEAVAQVKEENNVDAAVNLAATAKRLLVLIDEAEQLESQCNLHAEILL